MHLIEISKTLFVKWKDNSDTDFKISAVPVVTMHR